MIIPSRHPRLDLIAQGARWRGHDAYPSSVELADEHERWLAFLESRWQFDRYLGSLRGGAGMVSPATAARQRIKTFGEIGVIYFLEVVCGLPVLIWEPPTWGAPRGLRDPAGDALVALPLGQMFVEIKVPGWEGEVVRSEGVQSARRLQPKHIDGEARSTAPWLDAREQVAEGYRQLPGTMPSLLILNDDYFISLMEFDFFDAKRALWNEGGPFRTPGFERLGAVGVFAFEWWTDEPYRFALFANPHARTPAGIPRAVFERYPRFEEDPWGREAVARRTILRPARRSAVQARR